MVNSLVSNSLVLLQAVSVIVVAALLISRSRYFTEILDGRATWKSQLVLVLFFGAVSIYGTIIGINVWGAIINVRDLGPLVGGLAFVRYRGEIEQAQKHFQKGRWRHLRSCAAWPGVGFVENSGPRTRDSQGGRTPRSTSSVIFCRWGSCADA